MRITPGSAGTAIKRRRENELSETCFETTTEYPLFELFAGAPVQRSLYVSELTSPRLAIAQPSFEPDVVPK
ncbi:MAG: hypothetical protein QW115_02835, partial [Thermoplasmata archaeon]